VHYVTVLFGRAGVLMVLAWVALLAFAAWKSVHSWPRAEGFERWQVATTWCLLLVTLGLVGVTAVALDVFRPPHVVVALPALALAGGAALAQVRSPRWFAALIAVFVALSLVGVVKWYDDRPKQGWRAATAFVLDRAAPGDAVVFAADIGRIPFAYYARNDEARRDRLIPAYPAAPWDHWGTGDQRITVPSRAYLARLDRGNGRIWIVSGAATRDEPRFHGQDVASLRERFEGALTRHHKTVDAAFDAGVHVWRYDTPRSTDGRRP
jgi:hypothetical protein